MTDCLNLLTEKGTIVLINNISLHGADLQRLVPINPVTNPNELWLNDEV